MTSSSRHSWQNLPGISSSGRITKHRLHHLPISSPPPSRLARLGLILGAEPGSIRGTRCSVRAEQVALLLQQSLRQPRDSNACLYRKSPATRPGGSCGTIGVQEPEQEAMTVQDRKEPAPQNQSARPPRGQARQPQPIQDPYQMPLPYAMPDHRPDRPAATSRRQDNRQPDWPATRPRDLAETCPECGGPVSHESACVICHACGYSQCG
jgi:hypothetical protein